MTPLHLEPRRTALVLIDLQQGVVARPFAPHAPGTVVASAVRLAGRFRELGSPVVLVRVSFQPDGLDLLTVPADSPATFNPATLPAGSDS